MIHRSMHVMLLLAVGSVHAVAAQVGASGSDGVERTAIPNDYLEVEVARGALRIEGSAADRVEWTVRPVAGVTATNPNDVDVGTTTFGDRFKLRIGTMSSAATGSARTETVLRVPRELKLLHVSLHGTGKVSVDDFAGEVTITADSGDIAGTNLGGPAILEAREGGITLDLADTPFQRGPINLLSHDGSITLSLPAHPAVTLELSANCGNIALAFPMTDGRTVPGGLTAPAADAQDLDCTKRPKSLPPLPGVMHLHNTANMMLGDGSMKIRAMALQGDIDVEEKGAPTPGQCVDLPDLGRNPDGSPVTATVIGRVLDANSRLPVVGARLQVLGTSYRATSDKNGEYRLALDPHLLAKCRAPLVQVVAAGYTDGVARPSVGPQSRGDDILLHRSSP